MQGRLRDISKSPAGNNPKLEALEKKILSCYNADDSKQGILFCKTREMTTALMNWMKDNSRLARLNPNILIGARNTTRNGST
jgi:ATP-dependent RNA helicase DDX58